MSPSDARHEIIRSHVGAAMVAAVTPVPGVDVAAVTAIQVALVRRLARHHGVPDDAVRTRAAVWALAGASLARLGASAAKALPGAGWWLGGAAQAALSGASTWALAAVLAEHFEGRGTLEDLDAASMRERYREALARGRAVARAMRGTMRDDAAPDERTARLRRLEGLRRSGALTEDEFARLTADADPVH